MDNQNQLDSSRISKQTVYMIVSYKNIACYRDLLYNINNASSLVLSTLPISLYLTLWSLLIYTSSSSIMLCHSSIYYDEFGAAVIYMYNMIQLNWAMSNVFDWLVQ